MTVSRGRARTRVSLKAEQFGSDLVVYLFNQGAHIGAVSVADYAAGHATASVLTCAGHREDKIAREAAYRISNALKTPVCVVAGIHIDKAKPDEIRQLQRNAASVITAFLKVQAQGATPTRRLPAHREKSPS